ncbi:MAG: PAS domain-containing protein [Nitrospirae bacterium]|nr:PAS domain-containing protein [Nitrospirota bacterium]
MNSDKHREDVPEACEIRYKRIIDALTDCIYTVDIDKELRGKMTSISNCLSITGYSPEEFQSNPSLLHQIVHKEDRYNAEKQIKNLMSAGKCEPVEYRVLNRDGSVRWIKSTLVPQFDANGLLLAYDGLISDITRQKEMESRLIQSEKMASLGVLSAGMAHEIKNPLAIILKGIELLEVSPLKDSVHDVLDMMKDAVYRANRITKDLLIFSREKSPELEEIDLSKVTDETLSIVEHIFKFRQITIVKNFSFDLPRIRVDSNQMKQVLINLLTNASDAMPDGGVITITASKSPNTDAGNIMQLVIADTGRGITKEDTRKIFDPFYTTKKTSGGTGLGLSVVKGIIEKHKGTIRIESETGKGTSIIIELPY